MVGFSAAKKLASAAAKKLSATDAPVVMQQMQLPGIQSIAGITEVRPGTYLIDPYRASYEGTARVAPSSTRPLSVEGPLRKWSEELRKRADKTQFEGPRTMDDIDMRAYKAHHMLASALEPQLIPEERILLSLDRYGRPFAAARFTLGGAEGKLTNVFDLDFTKPDPYAGATWLDYIGAMREGPGAGGESGLSLMQDIWRIRKNLLLQAIDDPDFSNVKYYDMIGGRRLKPSELQGTAFSSDTPIYEFRTIPRRREEPIDDTRQLRLFRHGGYVL